MKSHSIFTLALLLVLFTVVSTLVLLFTIVEYTEYRTVWLLLLDFVYLPICFYGVYKLTKLAEKCRMDEFYTEYKLR